jgi:peptidoglycan/xylan/chitin deacetylase (PgdA/CDA1 family)
MKWIKKNSRNFGKMTTTPKRAMALVLAALIVAASVPAVRAFAESSASVLCYHSFHDRKKMDPYCFNLEELSSHIVQLEKEGFRFVSVNDIIYGRITGTKNILITVDDGNKSVYEAYQKVFRPHGIRPLLGIYPNIIINKKKYALTWEELAELANKGCDIAAHGYFHLKINQKLYDENPDYFKKEIFLSKKVIEEKLHRKVYIFMYPFGLRDDYTIKALKEAGYRYAFTIDRGKINTPVAGGDNVFELPRYMVTRNSWKYCLNRVMKNARPKVSYRVAVSDAESKETLRPEQKPVEAGGFALAGPSVVKKRGDVAGVSSGADQEPGLDDMPVLKRSFSDIFWFNGGNAMAAPVQKTLAGAHDGSASLSRPGGRNADIFPSSGLQTRSGLIDEPALTQDDGTVLEAKVERGGGVYLSNIKSMYHALTMHSYNTYHNVLGLVQEKVERIKHSIRKFAVSNF